MFRFYSLCSPSGKPDAAALAAAKDYPNEWVFGDGIWRLNVLGLPTGQVFFHYSKKAIYLAEPGLIAKVAPLPEKAEKFMFENWETENRPFGASLIKVPHATEATDSWFKSDGSPLNVADLDASLFGARGAKKTLPVAYFGQKEKEKKTSVLVPANLLGFLSRTQGPLRAKALVEEDGQKITFILKTSKMEFSAEVFFLYPVNVFDPEQKVILLDNESQIYMPLGGERVVALEPVE